MTAELSDFNESVLEKLKTLPIEQQKQVSDFINFLVNKYQTSKSEREFLLNIQLTVFGNIADISSCSLN